ncbi:MAG: hypothetical protein NC394_04445 [Bacteroides sp.]|nr:hypothetical protein [Bacteroides sp.]
MIPLIPWSNFGKLSKASELSEYLDGREYTHGGYYHYTSLDAINNIIGNKEFWISPVTNFNDIIDQKQYKDKERYFYSLCFSTGKSENLPLWYLYSGLEGKGGRIKLTKTNVKSLIEDSEYELCEKLDKSNNKGLTLPLKKDKNMILQFKDILYFREEENEIRIKYNTMTNYNLSSNEFKKLQNNHKYFIKGLIWFYEKETRLLVELIGDAKEFVNKNSDKEFIIKLKFDENILKSLKINLAPQIVTDKILEEIRKYNNIYNFFLNLQMSC